MAEEDDTFKREHDDSTLKHDDDEYTGGAGNGDEEVDAVSNLNPCSFSEIQSIDLMWLLGAGSDETAHEGNGRRSCEVAGDASTS